MDIEAPNELGDFEGQQQDFNGLDSDIIGRQTSGLESYVTDNSNKPREGLIQEYQEYRSNGSDEENQVYVEPAPEEQLDPVKRESGYNRRSSYLQSITEEGTILSDHDLMQDPLGVRDKSNEQTQDIIYNKRDPEEEFFTLSVLAQKMLATEKDDDTEYIYAVDAEKWFK